MKLGRRVLNPMKVKKGQAVIIKGRPLWSSFDFKWKARLTYKNGRYARFEVKAPGGTLSIVVNDACQSRRHAMIEIYRELR